MVRHRKKKLIIIVLLSLFSGILVLALIIYSQRRCSLIDLQKEMLHASAEVERQNIIKKLENYYLSIDIPDSIVLQLQYEFNDLLSANSNYNFFTLPDDIPDEEVLQLEAKFNDFLQHAFLNKLTKGEEFFRSVMEVAMPIVARIDHVTNNNYWMSFLEKVKQFDKNDAQNWILAKCAAQRCSSHHLVKFMKAELYGAYGLQLLQQTDDPRIRLDIYQRLLTILYRFHGMYDLAYPLAQKLISQADAIKYHLRAAGIFYHYANAFFLAGHNQLALDNFEQVFVRAENNKRMPQFGWYKRNAILGKAKAYWQSGDHQKALSLCGQIEDEIEEDTEEFELRIIKGIAFSHRGSYEQALDEYEKSLTLSKRVDDRASQIVALHDLGSTYFKLTEYDLAKSYFDEALSLLQKYNPKNYEQKIRLLLSFAELMAAQSKIEEFNRYIKSANDLIKLIHLPTAKAELLRSIGRLNLKMQRYKQAYQQVVEAWKLYQENRCERAASETELNVIECLIGLGKFKDAKQKAGTLLATDEVHQNAQRQIDALNLLAEIAHHEGHLDEAIRLSNQLIHKIDWMGDQFDNDDNLTVYIQKVYQFVKNAVQYEIDNNRLDSAYVKLDFLKSRKLKKKNLSEKNIHAYLDLDALKRSLNENQLIIDYLVTPDTLYVFAINRFDLRLLKRAVRMDDLQQLAYRFMKSITMTIDIFKNQPAASTAHFDQTDALSHQLGQLIMGWDELQTSIHNARITYVIPDDFLYNIPFSCLLQTDNRFLIQHTAVINIPSAFLLSSEQKEESVDLQNADLFVSIDHQFAGADELLGIIKNYFPRADEICIQNSKDMKQEIHKKMNGSYHIYFLLGHSAVNCKMPNLSTFEITAMDINDSSLKKISFSLDELKDIDWSSAEIVFLVGCETAFGKAYKGSGLAGMQQGILALGARAVIGSMWKIDAAVVNNQIRSLLQSYSKNKNLAIALQTMQMNAINELEQDSYYQRPHPYFWASLCLAKNTGAN